MYSAAAGSAQVIGLAAG